MADEARTPDDTAAMARDIAARLSKMRVDRRQQALDRLRQDDRVLHALVVKLLTK